MSVISYIAAWRASPALLDGVVSDNSELGQEYDIWVSIRISGPDYFKSGKPFPENEFYIDQIAVIRTTPDK